MGRDGFAFFTETKNVTNTWFSEDEDFKACKVDTWDGTITSMPVEK
jgi:malonate-semialdehyde dehydrogenase (acetylating)/methylmalonate-semialdehyde dehydrogenase